MVGGMRGGKNLGRGNSSVSEKGVKETKRTKKGFHSSSRCEKPKARIPIRGEK